MSKDKRRAAIQRQRKIDFAKREQARKLEAVLQSRFNQMLWPVPQ